MQASDADLGLIHEAAVARLKQTIHDEGTIIEMEGPSDVVAVVDSLGEGGMSVGPFPVESFA